MMRWSDKPVYIYCGYTNMGKSINGLLMLVQESFTLSLFVFCNKNRDRLKILEWDGDGFWLYFLGKYFKQFFRKLVSNDNRTYIAVMY